MPQIDIGDVARRAGLTPATLRYYEERGLIASTGRRGLRRQYDPSVLERLALVTLARRAGFSLDEIAATLGPGNGLSPDLVLLKARARQLDRAIRQLAALRDALLHAARCEAPNHEDCSEFRRLIQVASGREPRRGAGLSDAPPGRDRPAAGPADGKTT